MKIEMKNFFVSVVDDSLKEVFFDLDINMNIEVPLFCMPDILDGNWADYVRKINSLLESRGLTCGMHGPFYNLAYHSKDPMIRDVADRRMLQGIEIATALHSRFIVFHSTYSQYVAIKDYYKRWPSEAMRGLPAIVKEAEERKILIVIENIWDDGPFAIRGLLDMLKSESLKVCIDIGHLNIFSKVPLSVWFDVLSSDISHFHIHNNFGMHDVHNGLTEGNIDFEKFFDLVNLHKIHSTYTLEVAKLESVDSSIGYLKDLGVLDK